MRLSAKGGSRIRQSIKDFKRSRLFSVDVGITESATKTKKGRTVELALILAMQEQDKEFPVENPNKIPRRATLRPAIENAKYTPRVNNFVGNIFAGNGWRIGLSKIGEVATLKAKSNMQAIKNPKLSPVTIRNRVNKGTTNPLVDTKQLKKKLNNKINKL